jgi:hypothetical protein
MALPEGSCRHTRWLGVVPRGIGQRFLGDGALDLVDRKLPGMEVDVCVAVPSDWAFSYSIFSLVVVAGDTVAIHPATVAGVAGFHVEVGSNDLVDVGAGGPGAGQEPVQKRFGISPASRAACNSYHTDHTCLPTGF